MSPAPFDHRPLLRVLRTALYAVPLAWVLGGGCSWAYKSGGGHDDGHDDDGTTVVVVNGASSGGTGMAATAGIATTGTSTTTWTSTTTPVLDPELFRLTDCVIQFATPEEGAGDAASVALVEPLDPLAPPVPTVVPVLQRVDPLPPQVVIPGLSPARIWRPGHIGERELASFAAGVLSVNQDRLHLPLPVAELQYLDTQVSDSTACVRFGCRPAAVVHGAAPEGRSALAPILSVSFGATGELVSIERLASDTEAVLR